jgi:glutamate 5-kinase
VADRVDSPSAPGRPISGRQDEVSEARVAVARARRIVVKIGSRALASQSEIYERIAIGVRDAHAEKRSVVIVSSGAIALGMRKLGLTTRPKDMPLLQASAAAGQSVLMRLYEEAFGRHDLAKSRPHHQRERHGRRRRDQIR